MSAAKKTPESAAGLARHSLRAASLFGTRLTGLRDAVNPSCPPKLPPSAWERGIAKVCRFKNHECLTGLVGLDGNMDTVNHPRCNAERIMPNLKTRLMILVVRLAVTRQQVRNALALLHL